MAENIHTSKIDCSCIRFKLEKMNKYPRNRASNSIFVMLISQAYSGTVKRRYNSLRLSMPSPPLS